MVAGYKPGALRTFGEGDKREWGYNIISDDLTINSYFKGGVSVGRQVLNTTPVVGYGLKSGDEFSNGDYLGGSISLATAFVEMFTMEYGTIYTQSIKYSTIKS